MTRSLAVSLVIAALAGGCATRRALREDTIVVAGLPDAAARSAAYRAAATVMSREGYRLLNPAEPDGFQLYREPLRPGAGGPACEGVRLDASLEATGDRAVLRFVPCEVETEAQLFLDNGVALCFPQQEWESADCIDAALARLKRAWRDEARALLGAGAAATRPASWRVPPSPPAALAVPAAAASGCEKDSECKGDRICDAGRCTDPARR